ncbi:HEAT repeat domain-containing protein [Streptomyces sp. 147326]|uniref:HEAT repeat domain-containing protein n=1 Tax=Streptomyces sp. 147326 TaxID=3074379 RepID=UPI003857390A
MDIRMPAEALSGSWADTRSARDALVAEGAAVVGAVLEVLCDERSPVDWTVSADVLRRIGAPALLPLADASAAAESPEVARRTAWTLGRLEVEDQGVYEQLLSHAHPRVRGNALYAFQSRGAEAARFADRLIPLLGDPEPEVRQRAVRAFSAIGAGAVPGLRRVRQEPATGTGIRSGALEALADIGGPAALGGADLEAWRRLARIKRLGEAPHGMHLCGSWYAVPTDDQDAVLNAFDLGEPEPVTLRAGEAAWNQDRHGWDRSLPHGACARVFVSPVLDGWTLVFGDTSQDTHRIDAAEDAEEVLADVVRTRCIDLSRRFGAAHWYGMSCGDGWTAWCIAEVGEVVRHYDAFDAEEKGDEGPSHPCESGYLLPHEDGFPEDAFDGVDPSDSAAFAAHCHALKVELEIPDTCYANDIAARLSVDPGALGADTGISGHGVLALTACGREHGHPAGALPV